MNNLRFESVIESCQGLSKFDYPITKQMRTRAVHNHYKIKARFDHK